LFYFVLFTQIFYSSVVRLVIIRLYFGPSYLITDVPFRTPLFVSHCDISLIPRTPEGEDNNLCYICIVNVKNQNGTKGKEVTSEEKRTILSLIESGLKAVKVAELLNVNSSTICRFLKRFRERGDVENKHRSGQPRSITARDQKL
jgi:hypothetical protein